ncbi:MAG: DUF2188 domain-containing protein [Gaiellales bacterium]
MPDESAVITGPHPEGGRQNKGDGASRGSSRHTTKAEAVTRGRKIAERRWVEHRIQTEDGRIAESNSYGNDPRRIPG